MSEAETTWGWYHEGGRVKSGFTSREEAIEDMLRAGEKNALVGPMRSTRGFCEVDADCVAEQAQCQLDDLGLEYHVHIAEGAQRALDEWTRKYLEPDSDEWCDGSEVTGEELEAAEIALGGGHD